MPPPTIAGTRRPRRGVFVSDIEHAYNHVAHYPSAGSTRFGFELNIDGLRAHPLRQFPYLIFYLDRQRHLDVWRVLHSARDVGSLLPAPAGRPPHTE